jgi:preprotein translocase subunit YajC
MFSTLAHAQAAAGAAAGPGSFETMVIPMIAMFAIFYFLIIRPQSSRMKKHQAFLSSLKRGDQVLTSSGIFGSVTGITEKFITLEVAQGVQIRVSKSHIAGGIADEVQK